MTTSIGPCRAFAAAVVGATAFAIAAQPLAAQANGRIAGVVFDQATKLGLEGAEVQIIGTKRRMVTGAAGRYEFSDIAPGRYAVEGRRVGYTPYRDDSVEVKADDITKAYLVLRPIATLLENVVTRANGVEGEQLTVPARDAAGSLQGQVAGVAVSGSSLPGSELMIQLRAATSIRGNRPLIIVDGVTLATAQASTLDLSTMDIKSIEILKGASAAAAYGARGAAGVIIIRTHLGKECPDAHRSHASALAGPHPGVRRWIAG
jgi:TonB-dependent SusC/RagA subfamily outer membrane receptor